MTGKPGMGTSRRSRIRVGGGGLANPNRGKTPFQAAHPRDPSIPPIQPAEKRHSKLRTPGIRASRRSNPRKNAIPSCATPGSEHPANPTRGKTPFQAAQPNYAAQAPPSSSLRAQRTISLSVRQQVFRPTDSARLRSLVESCPGPFISMTLQPFGSRTKTSTFTASGQRKQV